MFTVIWDYKITFSFRFFFHFTVRICAEFTGRQPYSFTSDENHLIHEHKNRDFCLVYHSTIVPDLPVLMLLRAANVLPVCFVFFRWRGEVCLSNVVQLQLCLLHRAELQTSLTASWYLQLFPPFIRHQRSCSFEFIFTCSYGSAYCYNISVYNWMFR